MDHKERVAQGQNGGTKNEEKDGRTPFAGRVGIIPERPKSLENAGLLCYRLSCDNKMTTF